MPCSKGNKGNNEKQQRSKEKEIEREKKNNNKMLNTTEHNHINEVMRKMNEYFVGNWSAEPSELQTNKKKRTRNAFIFEMKCIKIESHLKY